MLPDDPMGSDDNIVNQSFTKIAAKRNKTTTELKHEVLKDLEEDKITDPEIEAMFQRATEAWGQSIEEAKLNTMILLRDEMRKKDKEKENLSEENQ
jgi:hypothetical protein